MGGIETLREPPESTEARELEMAIARVEPLTMVGRGALLDLAWMVRAVLTFDIPGALVECGVWRGGASFLMADLLRGAGATDRRVWMFDSFEGLPPPSPVDGPAALSYAENVDSPAYYDNCRASLDEVLRSAAELGLAEHTEIVKGWFEQTLPSFRGQIGPIALLRIDGDWYSSVRCCLENLLGQVVEGGLVIIDDYYAYDGCRLAVHEIFGERHLSYALESVTGSAAGQLDCAVFRKGVGTWKWLQQLYLIRQDLAAVIPQGETFVLVDERWFGRDVVGDRRAVPFLERNGEDWGAPADDATAVRELERLRADGTRFLVIAWPAFWWLDHYAGLNHRLRSTWRPVLENDRLVVFELTSARDR